MCTAIMKKGADVVIGFNLDIDPVVWNYSLRKTKDVFTVCIKVGSTTYYTHGVNSVGNFGDVPYMNGQSIATPKGAGRVRLDLLVDKFVRNKCCWEDVVGAVQDKYAVNPKGCSFHSLLCNKKGDAIIVEPGYGVQRVEDSYAVLTNFPVLANLTDFLHPFYGKDRYDICTQTLSQAGNDFSVQDALDLLCKVKQTGRWGTRISFVYSANDNAVYYCLDGDFDNVQVHKFQ